MKRYIEHMQTKDPHQRRTHAMQVAGALTAVVFVVWITTLGFRLTTSGGEEGSTGGSSQAASVITGAYAPTNGGLEVSTTSYLSY